HEDAGLEGANQRPGRVLVEDVDVVHRGERGDDLGAGRLRDQRTRGALQSPNRVVAVHADHEEITGGPGRGKIADVTDVQEGEAAIREDDGLPVAACRGGRVSESGPGDAIVPITHSGRDVQPGT